MTKAGPSTPILVLGLDGAPTAGDEFNVLDSEQEAKKIASKRMQLQREQSTRTQKHITLDEIGRRIAVGEFQELNIIVKGDVDGSIEALSDSMERLSTEEIKINIIQNFFIINRVSKIFNFNSNHKIPITLKLNLRKFI